MKKLIRIHHINKHSRVNGPGVRVVVWTQGCSLRCPGCFNEDTHLVDQESLRYDPTLLGKELSLLNVDGLTISGGEPLDQPDYVLELIKAFRRGNSGTVLLYTGYKIESILKNERKYKVIMECDAVIAGPYMQNATDIWNGKRLILVTDRILPEELSPQRKIEITFDQEQRLHVSGFPTNEVSKMLNRLL